MTLRERFFAKTKRNPETGCLEWTGSKDQDGYGHFWYKGKIETAHRVAWLIAKKEIPDGHFVCHHCDNRGCVEWKHLFAGTAQENNLDAIAKGHSPIRRAKLDEEKVRDIRRQYGCGVSTEYLAQLYGVTKATIYNVACRVTWKHVVLDYL